MARIEPSLYEPADDARIFDGTEETEDEGSRLPLLIVVALLVLAAFAGVVWLAYSQGVARGKAGAPRVLAAASSPVKVAPSNPGGAASPYRGLKIYQQPAPKDDDGDQPHTSTEEPPRAGSPAAVTDDVPSATKTDRSLTARTPTTPDALPQPTVRPSLRTNLPSPQAVPSDQMSQAVKPVPEKLASTAPTAVAKPPAAQKQPPQAAGDAGPQSSQKAASEAASPSASHPAQPSPSVITPAKPAADAAKTTATAAGGSYVLQIGSFKSEAEATSSWERFKAKHSTLVGGYGPNIQSVDLGAKGTWYRLRMGAFIDKTTAADLCVKLRADGASCLLGR